ncbi:MAG: M23 family metallopeptidase, partial [Candidatus Methylomirabilales bacterium]
LRVLSRLQPYGITMRKALLSVVAPLPVAGLAWWANDWHAPRCCPYPHLHQGLDLFARKGTPLVAAVDGVISQKVDVYPSGKGIEITDDEGTEYFYAHLASFARGLRAGDRVAVGDLIGTVGKSGNARTTKPHVHFEIQPGGVPVPPKPIVDGWLEDAEERALELVRATTGTLPLLDEYDFRLTRLFDLTAGAGMVGETPGELLTLAGIQPGLPSLEVAMQVLSGMAWEIDWGLRAEEALLGPSR